MLKYLLIAFICLLPMQAQAHFIGKSEVYRICPVRHIILGDTAFAESEVGGNHMFINPGTVGQYSGNIQRYIIRHECGHIHGINGELAADRYALRRTHLTPALANQLCDTVRDDPQGPQRCRQIQKFARR
jgi:hypothetical protein